MEIKRFIGGILEANCYVISSLEKECYIIDPGYNPGRIIIYIEEKDFAPKGVILTHHHNDHSGAAEKIRKELDCPVIIHRMDADMLKTEADAFAEDGDAFSLGDEKLRVIHTPGHTRGSICIMASKSRVCFTGDTIFNVDLGRTDLEDGSEAEMRRSMLEVCSKWENDITIYPGHGDPANMKTVRRINREFLDIVNDN